MSVRDPSSDGFGRAVTRSGDVPLSKYDLLLAAVPVLLLAGTVGGTTLPLPTTVGTGLGSVVAAILVGYGLFVASPVDGGGGRGGDGRAGE
ncbi:hypothetical protein [Halobaculum sp. EA56]|uniref:hypothetical protein n=1 Tax=Halobaculum sp. EA56 TaxID=3421648 RepID=UPI003EBC331A